MDDATKELDLIEVKMGGCAPKVLSDSPELEDLFWQEDVKEGEYFFDKTNPSSIWKLAEYFDVMVTSNKDGFYLLLDSPGGRLKTR